MVYGRKSREGRRRLAVAFGVLVLVAITVVAIPSVRRHVRWMWRHAMGGATVAERLEQVGPAARGRLEPHFAKAGVAYPPAGLALIGLKEARQLEVWARDGEGSYCHVLSYPILAASGGPGPKLREGDRQVPEGLYRVESLNPNSRYHLALRLNYPNADDRRRAAADGRTDLGGDIMIHGDSVSVGCLAMGDTAAEDLFVLVADAGLDRTEVILLPIDYRTGPLWQVANRPGLPRWTRELYGDIGTRLDKILLSPPVQVWNRACSGGGTAPRVADRALADLICADALIANGGVFHAVECLSDEELSAALRGYRLFGLDAAADLLVRARELVASDADLGTLEAPIDSEYAALAEGESGVEARFRHWYATRPQDFAPLEE